MGHFKFASSTHDFVALGWARRARAVASSTHVRSCRSAWNDWPNWGYGAQLALDSRVRGLIHAKND